MAVVGQIAFWFVVVYVSLVFKKTNGYLPSTNSNAIRQRLLSRQLPAYGPLWFPQARLSRVAQKNNGNLGLAMVPYNLSPTLMQLLLTLRVPRALSNECRVFIVPQLCHPIASYGVQRILFRHSFLDSTDIFDQRYV